jgi:RNA polymerase sigma-70 factor (ECF subfamily)
VRELITADARLLVPDRFEGPLADAPYFGRYESLAKPRQMAFGDVHGQQMIIALRLDNGQWSPHGIVRVEVVNNSITRVVNYSHCPWVLPRHQLTVLPTLLTREAYLPSVANRNTE